jgi:tryptophanyl-tRNA synthetase
VIRKQIKSAVTDSGDTPVGQISPGVENLFAMLKASGGHPEMEELVQKAREGTLQYGRLKEIVADALIAMTDRFKENRKEILENRASYQERIQSSSEQIRKKAQATVHEVKNLVGLMNVPT